jgi:hypothetical protein
MRTKILGCFAVVAMTATLLGSPATATTFDVTGEVAPSWQPYLSPGNLLGTIDIDTNLGTVTDAALTFSPLNSDTYGPAINSHFFTTNPNQPTVTTPVYQINVRDNSILLADAFLQINFTSSQNPNSLVGFSAGNIVYWQIESTVGVVENIYAAGISGSIAQTPLPSALPLFGVGLGLVGWLAQRRKRLGYGAV